MVKATLALLVQGIVGTKLKFNSHLDPSEMTVYGSNSNYRKVRLPHDRKCMVKNELKKLQLCSDDDRRRNIFSSFGKNKIKIKLIFSGCHVDPMAYYISLSLISCLTIFSHIFSFSD